MAGGEVGDYVWLNMSQGVNDSQSSSQLMLQRAASIQPLVPAPICNQYTAPICNQDTAPIFNQVSASACNQNTAPVCYQVSAQLRSADHSHTGSKSAKKPRGRPKKTSSDVNPSPARGEKRKTSIPSTRTTRSSKRPSWLVDFEE